MNVYNVIDVSEYIIIHEYGHNRGVTRYRLQVLLYFVQAAFLMSGRGKCFDVQFEAKNSGPFLECVDNHYKDFNDSMIPPQRGYSTVVVDSDKVIINGIVDYLGRCSTTTLEKFCREHKPWKIGYFTDANKFISDNDMEKYFTQ